MKLLVVGQGGREHCLGFHLKKNPSVREIFFAPGNGGTERIGKNIPAKNMDDILKIALDEKIDLTIVGSEQFLVDGIVDEFQQKDLAIFGPDKHCAKLEGSKVFAKNFMQKYGVPTAQYETFQKASEAIQSLEKFQFPLVIKASGLAAGKGVVIVQNETEAKNTIREMMEKKAFGDAGNEIVIEEFLQGYEVSLLSFFNGKKIFPMITAKDHKKIGEGETGLNTGGMGVVAPNPLVDNITLAAINQDIVEKTLQGLLKENLLFKGVIFFGIMVTTKGVFLLEYNLRMGDPETQAVLSLLESDLLDNIQACMQGEPVHFKWKKGSSCCVVSSSKGYPVTAQKGDEIFGLEKMNTPFFVAGAKQEKGKLVTDGGRVLNIVGTGETLEQARQKAYNEIAKVCYDGMYFRKDIGNL